MQVVPQGIESVNGSSVTMGCTSPLVDSGGVMVCESLSYLVDGCSPDIDTSTSNWASQLVTVRKNEGTPGIPYPHVLLTFGFDTAVSLTGIQMDLFNCPAWNIGTPSITVILNPDYDLAATTNIVNFLFVIAGANSLQSSCDSLSTVTISGGSFLDTSYRTVYILVDLSHTSSIQWVHVGEVRFIGIDSPTCQPTSPSSPIMTEQPSQPLFSSSFSPNATSMASSMASSSNTTRTSSRAQQPSPSTTSLKTSASKADTTETPQLSPTPDTPQLSPTPDTPQLSPTPDTPQLSPTPDVPPSGQSTSDNTLTIALVATIVGLILLVFILAGSIVFVLTRRRSRCNPTHYMVKAVSYELEKRSDPRTNTDNYLQATNPMESTFDDRYVCPSGSLGTNHSDDHYDFIKKEYISDALYDVVAIDEPPPPTGSAQPFPEDEFDGGHYEVIRPPVRSTEAAASSSPAKKDRQPNPQEQQSSANSKSPEEAARMYSLVKVRKAPKVPEKSSDLKDYLAVRIFNENIYSEPINPSDFISQQPEPEEEIPSDPIIYAPIYPSFTELPESFELPAEVNCSNIKEKSSLRTGHYGEVVLASTVGLSLKDLHLSRTETNKNVSVTVAMKKLKLDATPIQRRAFETEAKFLSRLRHPNVVRLLGACYEDPVFIMMEYMKDGDLSQFLQKYSEVVSIATPSSTTQITQSTLVFMASQICSGMKQLAALNFIHRDLATRNCLVGNNFSVKVASFGVDKDIYQSHYFRVQGNTLLPIRWMATECFDGKFSEKSDVWAFGVTMWEMLTLAKQLPYRHLSDEEVIHNALKREYRQFPTQSSSCPQSVYEIMERCWVMDFNERMTFRELHTLLQTVL